jgi:C4-dicarboxylate transporter DctM subunit
VLVIIVIGIVLFALLGAPLFAVFGAASIALFLNLPEGSWSSIGVDVFSAKFAESTTLMTIPLFTFAGYLLAESGAPLRLVRLSRAWLGWLPGGLPLVGLFTCAFFTTFTGGSGITIVAVGALIFPALLYEKYDEDFSLGLVTTGGSLGILFPPSVPLIFYGIVASLAGYSMSLNKLLVAGILPGTLVVAALAIYGTYVGIRKKVPRGRFNFREAWKTLWISKWELAIPFFLVGGLGLGVFRIHEASAFTALYVLFIELFIYRDISIKRDLPRVTIKSMVMVGAILAIVATAVGFCGWSLQAQIPDRLADWMERLISSKYMFLFLLNIFLLVVGMLMDIFTAIMVVVPLLMPIARVYHVDFYHLAIIFLLNLEIGYLTPPFGLNLFISTIRFSRPFMYVFRTVIPYLGILLVSLMIVTYVPWITTVLPDKIKAEEDAGDVSSELDKGAMEQENSAGRGGAVNSHVEWTAAQPSSITRRIK